MSEQLIRVHNTSEISLSEDMKQTVLDTRTYLEAAKADRTRRAYRLDWQDFSTWCMLHGLEELPALPETVSLYVSHQAKKYKVATVVRRLASISQAHQAARHETPTSSLLVRETMRGIRRTHGTAQVQKAPATTQVLCKLLSGLGVDSRGKRDRALLLLGFAGALRRSELVALNREDVTFTEKGAEILLRRSKTDQEGAGRKIPIPHGKNESTCPVRALRAWLESASIKRGAIFRSLSKSGTPLERLSGQSVALIVKERAQASGLDPVQMSGHSLRAGFVTSAAAAGVEERLIQRQSGHKSVVMLRRYIRDGDLWRDCAAGEVGL